MAKQVIVMRKDLNMTKGKMIAQGSHDSMAVILNMMDNGIPIRQSMPKVEGNGVYVMSLRVQVGTYLDDWLRGVFKKVCVYVNSEEELMVIYNKAIEMELPVALIEDAGLTMFKGVKTKTCLAIGPDNEETIDKITGHLKLL